MAAKIDPTELLRPGLLTGVGVVVARAAGADAPSSGAGLTETLAGACSGLGAGVYECALVASGDLESDDAATRESVEQALSELGEIGVLVVDAASSFSAAHDRDAMGGADREDAASPSPGAVALVRALEASWRITQAVANAAFIGRGAAGRIVYVAPRPDAGAQAEAAGAGLENLARTLSIEWARYGISPLAIAPGVATSPAEIAALLGYLASPAGDYFSGCLLDLRGPGSAGDAAPGR